MTAHELCVYSPPLGMRRVPTYALRLWGLYGSIALILR